MSQEKTIKIVLVAGEPSGDFLGAQLMKAIKKSKKPIEFYGVGGTLMEIEGLHPFFSVADLSIMSIVENIGQVIKIWKRLKEAAKKIEEIRPDLVVTIDFPGFNFRLGRLLKRFAPSMPVIHYVAPTVWAWRAGRAKKVSRFLDHLLTLFPFEPSYFRKYKLPTSFVGHPVVEMEFDKGDANRFLKKYGLHKEETVLTLLPGSRIGELKHHLPVFQKTIDLLSTQISHLKVIVPTVPHLKEYLEKNWVNEKPAIFITDLQEKKDAYAASQIAIAASGTIALELAEAGLPMIIAYKVSPVSAWFVKLLVKVKHFCMINIMLHKYIVPELLQENCTPKKIAIEVLKVLRNPQKIYQQKEAFHRIKKLLRPDDKLPSEKAAEIILSYLSKGPQSEI